MPEGKYSRPSLIALLMALVLNGTSPAAWAAGMLPESSIIIVYEADGEASINIKNTDDHPALLLSSVTTIDDDSDNLLIATPPVTRVEAGETQLIRFILRIKEPLNVQQLQRVTFEGIPPKNTDPGMRLNMNVRQNLPAILHPKGLPLEREPWTLLQWSITAGQLHVHNPSPYVVRMSQGIELLPSGSTVELPNSYLLPGQSHAFALPAAELSPTTSVKLFPATIYGYSVDSYIATLTR